MLYDDDDDDDDDDNDESTSARPIYLSIDIIDISIAYNIYRICARTNESARL